MEVTLAEIQRTIPDLHKQKEDAIREMERVIKQCRLEKFEL